MDEFYGEQKMKIMKPISSREAGKLLYKTPDMAAQGKARRPAATTAPRVALVPSGPALPRPRMRVLAGPAGSRRSSGKTSLLSDAAM